jgi:hypothetical protein
MAKKRRVYQPRIIDGKVMLQADFERLHKYMREVAYVGYISDEMCVVIESEWPELVPKLPPKKSQDWDYR